MDLEEVSILMHRVGLGICRRVRKSEVGSRIIGIRGLWERAGEGGGKGNG